MTTASPTSGSFTINRHFKHDVAKVFAAFSNPATKAKWFTGPMGGEALERVIEVKTGGSEVLKFKHPSGMVTHFIAKYHAVEPGKRIVYSYDLMIDGKHHSTSLAVVEFTATGKNTDMIFTEFVAWHDGTGRDAGLASREKGTSWQFDKIVEVLAN
jgi:uncharacterized protein YndB with AHSA1/START domain